MKRKRIIIAAACALGLITGFQQTYSYMEAAEDTNTLTTDAYEAEPIKEEPFSYKVTDWRLALVNFENIHEQDFDVDLDYLPNGLQFDKRAIGYLNKMVSDMKKSGVKKIWCQSTYRSVEYQNQIFDRKLNTYLSQGYSEEEAQKLTEEYINHPGTSEHNLGLAVDFNTVENDFENTDAFKWLKEHAAEYGFVLRYPKDKEDITKISYESWHWRYVGAAYAADMNEKNMCLEEYVEYLQNNV